MFLPAGVSVIKASANGKPVTRRVYVDATTAARLQADLETMQAAADANQKARPCGMFDHKTGKASFLPKRFWWLDGRGVMLDVEWTKAGREAVEGRDYSYFSPTFKLRNGVVTGLDERVEIGSLVNSPAFESMERIAAARTDDDLPEDGSEVVLCGEVDTLETLEARKADIERRIDELKDGDHAPKSAPKNGQGVDDEAADDAKTDAKHDDGGDLSPMKKAHLAVLKRMDGEQRVKEGKKGGALDGVMARVRHAAACAGCEPAIKGAREIVQAANPYGCNQFRHGPGCPRKGESSHSDKNGGSSGGKGSVIDKMKKEIEKLEQDFRSKRGEYAEFVNHPGNIWDDDERAHFKENMRKAEEASEEAGKKLREAKKRLADEYRKRGEVGKADWLEYEATGRKRWTESGSSNDDKGFEDAMKRHKDAFYQHQSSGSEKDRKALEKIEREIWEKYPERRAKQIYEFHKNRYDSNMAAEKRGEKLRAVDRRNNEESKRIIDEYEKDKEGFIKRRKGK